MNAGLPVDLEPNIEAVKECSIAGPQKGAGVDSIVKIKLIGCQCDTFNPQ